MKKIKILRIIHTLDPNFGGPQNAIIDNSLALIKKGFIVDVLTSDQKNIYKKNQKLIKIFNIGPSFLKYGFNIRLIFWLIRNRKKYDMFIIHGLWTFYTLIARFLLKNKYFVFAHGQLDPFFSFDFSKKIKKKFYWHLIEKQNLIKSNSLLLTTENEKKLLLNTYVNTNKIKKKNVSYGILRPKFNITKAKKLFYKKFPNLKNKYFLIFLGRFHEKKGCDKLLKALKILKKQNIKIRLLLAGPDNDYKDRLKELSKNLDIDDQVFWSNAIKDETKWGALYLSQGMVLCSNGENFGVSLVESLSLGKPVLTTNKVNIYNKIKKYKCGLISKNDSLSFSGILNQYFNFNKKTLENYSKNSIKCFNKEFNLENNINIFSDYLKKFTNKV